MLQKLRVSPSYEKSKLDEDWIGCGIKAYILHEGPGEKATENFERLGRQVRQGIEPVTFRLPVLKVGMKIGKCIQ